MLRIQAIRIAVLLAVLSSAACGDRDAEAGVSARADAAVDGASGDGSGGSAPDPLSADQVEVSISKPPFDGAHQASGNMECFHHAGTWGASFDNERDRGLSAMLMIVKGVPATGGTSGDVAFSLTFGKPVMDEVDHSWALIQIHGTENGGDARVTVTREGSGAVLRIEGAAQHGAQVRALVRCRTVNFVQ